MTDSTFSLELYFLEINFNFFGVTLCLSWFKSRAVTIVFQLDVFLPPSSGLMYFFCFIKTFQRLTDSKSKLKLLTI